MHKGRRVGEKVHETAQEGDVLILERRLRDTCRFEDGRDAMTDLSTYCSIPDTTNLAPIELTTSGKPVWHSSH